METRRTICEMGEEKGLVAAILEARVQLQLAPLPAFCLSWGRGIATAGASGAKERRWKMGRQTRENVHLPKQCERK